MITPEIFLTVGMFILTKVVIHVNNFIESVSI